MAPHFMRDGATLVISGGKYYVKPHHYFRNELWNIQG